MILFLHMKTNELVLYTPIHSKGAQDMRHAPYVTSRLDGYHTMLYSGVSISDVQPNNLPYHQTQQESKYNYNFTFLDILFPSANLRWFESL